MGVCLYLDNLTTENRNKHSIPWFIVLSPGFGKLIIKWLNFAMTNAYMATVLPMGTRMNILLDNDQSDNETISSSKTPPFKKTKTLV